MVKKAGNTFVSGAMLCILLMYVPAIAIQEISFSGEQDGFFEQGQYVATGTITVKRGKTLTFAPGCVIRFKQYAGIVIEGTLKCMGLPLKQIIFTSDNNRANTANLQHKVPAPFDWNGITVVDSAAAIVLENVRIAYTTYGLDIKSTISKVSLKGVVFSDIGRSGMTIGEKQLGVIENELFSFVQPQPQPEIVFVDEKKQLPPAAAPKPKALVPAKKMTWRTPVRLSLGAIGIAGFAAGVYENTQVGKLGKIVNNSSTPTDIANNDVHKIDAAEKLRTLGYVIGIAAACGFSLTFFF